MKKISLLFFLVVFCLTTKAQTVKVGDTASEIAEPSPDGDTIKLSSLRGKVVLVDFWASWCGPCRAFNPTLVRIYNKYKDKGFEIYGVSFDRDLRKWKAAIKSDKLNWIHVSDLKYWGSKVVEDYGVDLIPAAVLLDTNGKIIAVNPEGKQLEKKLKELLK